MRVTIPDIGALSVELSHFTDSSRNGVSEGAWVVVQEGHFWVLESPILAGLSKESRNVRLAALNLTGISGWIQGSQGSESVIFGILRFH